MCKENGTSTRIDAFRQIQSQFYNMYLPVSEHVAAECRLTAKDELEVSKYFQDASRQEYLEALVRVQQTGKELTTQIPPAKTKPGVQIPTNEFNDRETRNLMSGYWWRVFMGGARETAGKSLELYKAGGPGVPGVPFAKRVGKTTVKLGWEPPTNDGGAFIDGYKIEKVLVEIKGVNEFLDPLGTVTITSKGKWETAITHTWSDVPSWTVGGLHPDRVYRFRVFSINRVNVSPPGSESTKIATKSDSPAPAIPTSPTRVLTSVRKESHTEDEDDEDGGENSRDDEDASGGKPAPRDSDTRRTTDLPFWNRFRLEASIASHEHGDDAFVKTLEQLDQWEAFWDSRGFVLIWLMCSGRVLYDIGEKPVASGRLGSGSPAFPPDPEEKEEEPDLLEWLPTGKRVEVDETEEDGEYGYPKMSQSEVPVASFTLLKLVIGKFWLAKCAWGSVADGLEDGAQCSLFAALSLVCDAAREGGAKLEEVRQGMPPFPISRNLSKLTGREGLLPDHGQAVEWAQSAYDWAVRVLDRYGGEAVEHPISVTPVLDRILAVVTPVSLAVTLRPADLLAVRPMLPDCAALEASFKWSSEAERDFNFFPLKTIAKDFVEQARNTQASSPTKAGDGCFSLAEISQRANTPMAKRYVARMNSDLEETAAKLRPLSRHVCSISREGLGAVHQMFNSPETVEELFPNASSQLACAVRRLGELQRVLLQASHEAQQQLSEHRRLAVCVVNEAPGTLEKLRRLSAQRPFLSFTLTCAAMLCHNPVAELRKLNPALDEPAVERIKQSAFASMFWSIRFRQLSICIDLANSLGEELRSFIKELFRALWPMLDRDPSNEATMTAVPPDDLLVHALRQTNYDMVQAKVHVMSILASIRKMEMRLGEAAGGSVCDQSVNIGEQREAAFILMAAADFDDLRAAESLSSAKGLLELARSRCFNDDGAPLRRPPNEWLGGDEQVGAGGVRMDMIAAKFDVVLQKASSLEGMLSCKRHWTTPLPWKEGAEASKAARAAGMGEANAIAAGDAAAKAAEDQKADNAYTTLGRSITFDPRFLVFEFMSPFMLRDRQCELSMDLAEKADTAKGATCQQMIMGSGKTTVIGPLVALLLADGHSLITQIVPDALLDMSRNVMRSVFTSVVVKRVFTLTFNRNGPADSLVGMKGLNKKLQRAQTTGGVVCSVPGAVKSLMLKYLDLLATEESATPLLLVPRRLLANDRLEASAYKLGKKLMANAAEAAETCKVLQTFTSGKALIDEVDLVLNPLKSELNFPTGKKEPLDLAPARWELPIHLLDGVYYALGERPLCDNTFVYEAERILEGNAESGSSDDPLSHVLEKGKRDKAIVESPHLTLLHKPFYTKNMLKPVARWCVPWLLAQKEISRDKEQARREMGGQDRPNFDALVEAFIAGETGAVEKLKVLKLQHGSLQLLNLAKQWVCSFLPHTLSKRSRIEMGLLQQHDIERLDAIKKEEKSRQEGGEAEDESEDEDGESEEKQAKAKAKAKKKPGSRQLLCVPFVGKDVPSTGSEFSSPEVVIGMTIAAFRIEGMREADMKVLILKLSDMFSKESGPPERRSSGKLVKTWREIGTERLKVAAASAIGGDLDIPEVLPLELLQPSEPAHMRMLMKVLARVPTVAMYYLRTIVFPQTQTLTSEGGGYAAEKLSASGADVGGDCLFGVRLGFSGTPSDLIPLSMQVRKNVL